MLNNIKLSLLTSATLALCTALLPPVAHGASQTRSNGVLKVQNLLSTTGRSRRLASTTHANNAKSSAGAAQAAKNALSTLDRLDSAANVLLALADERLKPAEVCNIQVEASFKLLNALQSRIDGGTADYTRFKAKAGSAYADPSWPTTCEASCHCGLYSAILETIGFEKLSDADRKIYRSVSNLAVNQTREELTQCARRSNWFCSSALKRELESEAAANQ